jgi:hypothetical protein
MQQDRPGSAEPQLGKWTSVAELGFGAPREDEFSRGLASEGSGRSRLVNAAVA